MEARRRGEKDGAEWRPLPRGWRLGPPEFKYKQLTLPLYKKITRARDRHTRHLALK